MPVTRVAALRSGRLLAAVLGLLAAALLVAPAARAEPTTGQADAPGFYCGAASTSVPCRPCRPDKGPDCGPGAHRGGMYPGMIYVSIDNHAAGGEVCRLYVDGVGYYNNIWFDAGDYGAHAMGTVPANRRYNVYCMRRAASGDAGIGGYIGYGD
jgi:hypothetical protein